MHGQVSKHLRAAGGGGTTTLAMTAPAVAQEDSGFSRSEPVNIMVAQADLHTYLSRVHLSAKLPLLTSVKE